MKKFILPILLLLPTFILSNSYLQDGLYPECSYVIVDQEGWKIHMNQDGKVISMTPKSKHNEKTGKYSFDKFGNLVPFRECNKSSYKSSKNTTKDSKVDIEIEIDLFNNLDFSVYGAMSTPFGKNIDMYETSPLVGIEIKLGNYIFAIDGIMYEYINESSVKKQILSNNIFLGYKLDVNKFYVVPSLAIYDRKQQQWGANTNNGITSEGIDIGTKIEIGYNFNQFSIFASSNYSTTLSETEQTATFYNLGLKYNF